MTTELRRLVTRFAPNLPGRRLSKRAARKAQAAALEREAEHRPRRALTPFQDRNRVVA